MNGYGVTIQNLTNGPELTVHDTLGAYPSAKFFAGSNVAMLIVEMSSVGINKTAPTAAIDVSGNVAVRGSVTANKFIVSLGASPAFDYNSTAVPASYPNVGPTTVTETDLAYQGTVTGQATGNGTYYVTTSSSMMTYGAGRLAKSTGWDYFTGTGELVGFGGIYANNVQTSTTVTSYDSTSTYTGEYVQFHLPTAIYLSSYKFGCMNTFAYNAPQNFAMFGSTNGSTWHFIDIHTDYAGNAYNQLITFSKLNVSVSTAYSYFRFAFTPRAYSTTAQNSFENGCVTTLRGMILTGTEPVYNTALQVTGGAKLDAIGVGKVPTTFALDVSGTVNATAFIGDGSGLSNVVTKQPVVAFCCNNGGIVSTTTRIVPYPICISQYGGIIFSSSTSTFTAPIGGIYSFSANANVPSNQGIQFFISSFGGMGSAYNNSASMQRISIGIAAFYLSAGTYVYVDDWTKTAITDGDCFFTGVLVQPI